MEYLRTEVVEKEEDTEMETRTIQTIALGGNSTEDDEVSQTLEASTEREMRISLVGRIKTIGQYSHFNSVQSIIYQLKFQKQRCCLVVF